MARLAVYPGSFDPLTNGHLDIIRRSCRVFDNVVVAVSNNASKSHTFTVEERLLMAKDACKGLPNAYVDTFTGLLVDYLRRKKARILIRGLRVVSDMDYEFQLASFNRRLSQDVETVFLMPDERYTYLSASMVKEVARLGASAKDFVPPAVAKLLSERFGKPQK